MMDKKMEFHRNVPVEGTSGRQVGHLERVVLETETRTLTHLVVRIGGLLNKKDKLVPVGHVGEASPAHIVLTVEAGDPEAWADFEAQQVVAVTQETAAPVTSQPAPTPAAYGAPIAGLPSMHVPEPYKTQTVQNIPDGTVAVTLEAKVLTMDGKSVGSIEAVRSATPADRVTHFLVSSGLLTRERKWVPAEWAEGFTDDEIQLGTGQEVALENLEVEGSTE
jgi:uncharacterized protein YrrD